jgi:(S)-sulfolactate dehydrogenase
MSDLVITEQMAPAVVDRLLRPRFQVHYDPDLVDDRPRLRDHLADARGLIVRNRTQVDRDLLDAAPGLTVVGRLGVGLDNIDTAACAGRGIKVCPAAGANARSVAEYVITSVLMLRRGCYRAAGRVATGEWPRSELQGDEAAESTLGLVGFGGIARAVAVRARALGLRVIAADPQVPPDDPSWAETGAEPCELAKVLAESDAVSLHVPLTDATRHLIDAAAIARMPAHAVLINTARGGVVDDAALASALRSGRLRAAALDVFETEPLPAGSAFAGLDNVILTPHIAGLTRQSNQRVSETVAMAVAQALDENAP